MSEAKIQFSGAEMELMNNANIILTKNAILQKIKGLLEELQMHMQHAASEEGYEGHPLFVTSPKISRGENYEGLPYLVLDYPRVFEVADIFAVRTMFWWGHLFSITLQISGKYKEAFLEKLTGAYTSLSEKNFFIGVGDDPWQHHFEADNYKRIAHLTGEEFGVMCCEQEHIKIARQFPLWDVHFVTDDLLTEWLYIVSLCLD